MKKFLILTGVLLVTAGAAFAQTNHRNVEATDIRMIQTDGNVTVSFTLDAGKKAVKAGYDLAVTPVIKSDVDEMRLPSIIIRDRRSKVADLRHEIGGHHNDPASVYMAPGTSLDYTTTVPYEGWMRGGELLFDGVSVGCCSSNEVELGLVADNILYAEPEFETKVVEIPTVTARSTGEQLAALYPFVTPVSESKNFPSNAFDDGRNAISQRMSAEIREGSISVFFRQGGRTIDRNFGENNKNLVELISAVRILAASDDTRIARIMIAGFSSPEGSVSANERLAHDRAVAVKEFLTANSGVDPRTIQIYNGGADWTGLRELIAESDYYQKQRMIEIIDNTPVWDSRRNVGRLGELMRLDGGAPYLRMAREFFPQLRQAAYIKIYYENKTK